MFFRSGTHGGVALRISVITGDAKCAATTVGAGQLISWEARSEIGTMRAVLEGVRTGLEQFIYTVRLSRAFHVDADHPRYKRIALGEGHQVSGKMGLCFIDLTRPALGKLLYVQNLAALNPYLRRGKQAGKYGRRRVTFLGYSSPTQPKDPSKALGAGAAHERFNGKTTD